MSYPNSCACTGTAATVNVPGVAGNDGRNAYSVAAADLVVPANVTTTTTFTGDQVAWMIPGMVVQGGNPTDGIATFRVAAVNTSLNQATLYWLKGVLDVAAGTTLTKANGTIVSPVSQGAGALTVATQSVASPTGTTSTSPVMAGLGAAGAVLTPVLTGRVKVNITGVAQNGTATDGINLQIAYGTGGAPANGAAAAGTTLGSIKHIVAATGPGKQGFAACFIVSGLTKLTQYWFDLQFNAVTGGTATLFDVDVVLTEI